MATLSEVRAFVGQRGYRVLAFMLRQGCPACEVLHPLLLAYERERKVPVLYVDAAEAAEAVTYYGITSAPTLIPFLDGVERPAITGVRDARAVIDRIDSGRLAG